MNVDTRGSSASSAIPVDSDDEGPPSSHPPSTSASPTTPPSHGNAAPKNPTTTSSSLTTPPNPKSKKNNAQKEPQNRTVQLRTRPYQQEMLDLSLRQNVIVALDTGAGKTHIAILRIKAYLEGGSGGKLAWFLTPTVALCTQQHAVLSLALPFPCALLSGAAYPDQWKDAALWRGVVRSHRVVVSTPQILLDALRHGYLSLGRDVGLLVFDEAHHCVERHPYRMVMQEFYFSLPPRARLRSSRGRGSSALGTANASASRESASASRESASASRGSASARSVQSQSQSSRRGHGSSMGVSSYILGAGGPVSYSQPPAYGSGSFVLGASGPARYSQPTLGASGPASYSQLVPPAVRRPPPPPYTTTPTTTVTTTTPTTTTPTTMTTPTMTTTTTTTSATMTTTTATTTGAATTSLTGPDADRNAVEGARERESGHEVCRPAILGLTASPVYGGGDVDRAFRAIESNLDALIVTPSLSRPSLSAHVHRPTFKHVGYFSPSREGEDGPPFSTNLAELRAVVEGLDIEEDPYVIGLRRQLAKHAPPTPTPTRDPGAANVGVGVDDPGAQVSPEYRRLDQKLSKVLDKKDSFAQKGLRDFERAASEILWTVGAWACDWFVWTVVRRVRGVGRGTYNPLGLVQFSSWRNDEKRYLAKILGGLTLSPPSYFEDDIVGECSDKVRVLIQALLDEKEEAESSAPSTHSTSTSTPSTSTTATPSSGTDDLASETGERSAKQPEPAAFSGLVFVQRRDAVLALAELLSHHPATKEAFRIGTLLGSSESAMRHALMDVTRGIEVGGREGDKDDEDDDDDEGEEQEGRMDVDAPEGGADATPSTSASTSTSSAQPPDRKGKSRAAPTPATPSKPGKGTTKKLKAHSAKAQQATLAEFRSGEKNLIISTAVAEEGIDIQACGCVVRWDPPSNMASWVQSRGRARKKRSTFVLLYDVEEDKAMGNVAKWTEMEERMVMESRMRVARAEAAGGAAGGSGGDENVGEDGREEVGDWDEELRSEATGATINPHSAVSHLSHFCAIISRSGGSDNRPIYDLDPPDYPLSFHTTTTTQPSLPQAQSQGPWSSTVHLPRSLPIPQRSFSTLPKVYPTKLAAHRHAAFAAYKALHGWGLLNEHLLPFGNAGRGGEEEEEVRALLREVERREGVVGVKVQIDPWAWEESGSASGRTSEGGTPTVTTPIAEEGERTWYVSEMRIDGLPPLVLFTLRPMLDVEREEGPELFRPGREVTRVSVTPARKAPVNGGSDEEESYETVGGGEDVVQKAREYTRMVFWCFYSARMEWEKTDYAYLVLPVASYQTLSKSLSVSSSFFTMMSASIPSTPSSTSSTTLSSSESDDTWADRRSKLASLRDSGTLKPARSDMAYMLPGDVYTEHFTHSEDVIIVRKHSGQGKPMRFVGWQFDKLDEEGEERVREGYESKSKKRRKIEAGEKGKEVLGERTNVGGGDAMDVDSVEEKAVEDVLMGVEEQEEEERLEITYPLIIAEPFPPRTNFLHPLPASSKARDGGAGDGEGPSRDAKVYLLPSMTAIAFYSYEEVEYAFLLPSILRWLGHNLTVASFQRRHWSSPPPSPLLSIPRSLLTVALTAPVSGERYNYQRLETLGDAVLKYVVGVQLYAEYPMWHEGYLTRAKDHAVNNAKLAKECVKRGVFRWILREVMMGKKWAPRCVGGKVEGKVEGQGGVEEGGGAGQVASTIPVEPVEQGGVPVATEASSTASGVAAAEGEGNVARADETTPKKKKKRGKGKGQNKGKNQELSTKVLADVVEALIGAAYEHGGFDLGQECAKFFDLGVKWQPLSSRLTHILANVRPDTDIGVEIPSQIADVESMIGYTFQHKILLIEALTHASYREHISTISYERLEFLGDSILDMVATDYLYHAPGKEYSPGHMHIRKSAVVNGHFLAYICLGLKHTSRAVMPQPLPMDDDGDLPRNPYATRMEFTAGVDEQDIYLWQCLLHSNQQVLDDQTNTFTRYEKWKDNIRHALEHETVFPWAALTRLQAPKFFSDIVEAIIGAVYLDCGGNMDTVKRFLRGIGILPVLERIVNDGVDVFHPVSRVSMWASSNEKTVEYVFEHSRGDISCVLLVDGEEEVRETEKYRGKSSQEEVKFAAAEKAIKQFRLRDAGAKSGIGDKKDKVGGRAKRKRGPE